MESGEKSNVVIVGGVAAGPKTAATLARRHPDWRVTLFERGEHISYGTCGLPYYASGDISSLEELNRTNWGVARSPEFFASCKGFEVVTGAEVTAIDRTRKTVAVRLRKTGSIIEHGYDRLVLATGALPKGPSFECAESELVRHFTRPEDAMAFRRMAEQGRVGTAVIIGGGFIGCELAEAAAGLWGIQTTLIEYEPQVLPYALDPDMAGLLQAELKRNGVSVVTSARVEAVREAGDQAQVIYRSETQPEGITIAADYVFLALGVTPETRLAAGCGLEIGVTGGIVVNEHMQTSDPDIYAGGDCVQSTHVVSRRLIYLPMGSLANRHGRVIAEHIAGYDGARFPGVVGAMVLKAFDLNTGSVGLTGRAAAAAGLQVRSVCGAFGDRPDYYPEHESLTAKLVYDPSDMRLLGIQAIGKGDICRRIDVVSAFLRAQASVSDLLDHEHGYAPPYAEALDPLHHLAAMALAQEQGISFVSACHEPATRSGALWLDVREPEEAEAAPLPSEAGQDVLRLPLGRLRSELDKMDRNREIYVVCRRGPRAYQAAVFLRAAGFTRVHVVGGGATAMGL